MTPHAPATKALLILAALGLSACDGGLTLPRLGGAQAAESDTSETPAAALPGQDVEAPELFDRADKGLWDGRPSLGGVWVAHESVTDPQRVIIRNQDNGSFVIGALFRKESATPGPKFQISSDAAEALDMLAGAPAQLKVTALRKGAPAPDPTDDSTAADGAATPDVAATPITPAKPTASPAADSTLAQPFVQIGIFSVEANAKRAARTLSGEALPTMIRKSSVSGKTYWRVLVGPATTTAERSKLLRGAKSAGFTDAYLVSN